MKINTLSVSPFSSDITFYWLRFLLFLLLDLSMQRPCELYLALYCVRLFYGVYQGVYIYCTNSTGTLINNDAPYDMYCNVSHVQMYVIEIWVSTYQNMDVYSINCNSTNFIMFQDLM